MLLSFARWSRFALALLALAPGLGAQRLAQRSLARAPTPLVAPIRLDFDTEDDFVTPLSNGQAVSSPEEFGRLVSISGDGANLGPALFDSTPGGPNDPSQDGDLLVGRGNVLILQNSQAPIQTVPGVFDRPNDDQDGGRIRFDFATPVEPVSLVLIDIDTGTQQGASVRLVDEGGRARVYLVPPRWTRDLLLDGAPAEGVLSLQVLDPQPGFLSTATATEDAGFDSLHVVRLEVALGSSGAVDDLEWRPGRSLGILADYEDARVAVFDADHDVVLGLLQLPYPAVLYITGDCVVDPRSRLGYVANQSGQVWVVDLGLSPPELAGGINPIVVPGGGVSLALSPDGRFLAVSGFPLSIVDLATRAVTATATVQGVCVDFGDDETLVGATIAGRLQTFSFTGGTLSLTGDVPGVLSPQHLAVAPGGRVGAVVSPGFDHLLTFRVDGLVPVSLRSADAISVCAAPDGLRLFVRGFSSIAAWSHDPLGGVLGDVPLYSVAATSIAGIGGVEQMVVHPDGTRLYVPVPNAIRIHAASDGTLLHTVPATGIVRVGGIAIGRGLR